VVVQWWYSGGTQWWYSGGTQWWYNGVRVVLKWCDHKREVCFLHQLVEELMVHAVRSINNHVTLVVQWCYNDVTVVLQ
jgi:hypothetical protein